MIVAYKYRNDRIHWRGNMDCIAAHLNNEANGWEVVQINIPPYGLGYAEVEILLKRVIQYCICMACKETYDMDADHTCQE